MKLTQDLALGWVSEGMADLWVLQLEPTPDRGVLAVFLEETGSLSITKLGANQQPSWTMPFGGPGMQTQIYDLAVGGGAFVVAGTDAGAGFLARFRLPAN